MLRFDALTKGATRRETKRRANHGELTSTIRFLTPAFLGDAEQTGRWHAAPCGLGRVVSLLRQVGLTGGRLEHLFDDLGVKDAAGVKRKDDPLRAFGVDPMAASRAK